MEKYLNNSLYEDCSSRVYDCGRQHPGASMPPNLAPAASHKSGSVFAVANAQHACPGCAPFTNGASTGTWRGKRTRGAYTEGILLWDFPDVAPKCSYGLT